MSKVISQECLKPLDLCSLFLDTYLTSNGTKGAINHLSAMTVKRPPLVICTLNCQPSRKLGFLWFFQVYYTLSSSWSQHYNYGNKTIFAWPIVNTVFFPPSFYILFLLGDCLSPLYYQIAAPGFYLPTKIKIFFVICFIELAKVIHSFIQTWVVMSLKRETKRKMDYNKRAKQNWTFQESLYLSALKGSYYTCIDFVKFSICSNPI